MVARLDLLENRNTVLMAPSLKNLSLYFLLCLSLVAVSNSEQEEYTSFLKCLSRHTQPWTNLSQLLYTPNTSSYSSLLESSMQNLLFASPAIPKPLLILAPSTESHVQASVICCRSHALPLRVRSGGHDYEGVSYRSCKPGLFAMLDLANLRAVEVDTEQSAAWAQAGATLGELYYGIAEKSRSHGFPAGICPTVGVGGHISGGGYGPLVRKYGLAADQILDARLVDVHGRILDRKSMGEDLFWAIRGGGGASFGVIVSWKLNLVHVPPILTAFTIHKSLEQRAMKLVSKWQHIAYKLHEDLFIKIDVVMAIEDGKRRVEVVFESLFLGGCTELLHMMSEGFPELGVEWSDCREMSWIESTLYFAGYTNGEPIETLLNRGLQPKEFIKGKSDYLNDPIPTAGWERIWKRFLEEGAGSMNVDPHGGRMSEILASSTPFPHRNGTLYSVQYLVRWKEGGIGASEKHLGWVRSLHKEMTPYVSRHPRGAYLNYRDLDLGVNEEGNRTSYSEARIWGEKYFKNNFRKLARVKEEVDPENFFWNEQSIPPLCAHKEEPDLIALG